MHRLLFQSGVVAVALIAFAWQLQEARGDDDLTLAAATELRQVPERGVDDQLAEPAPPQGFLWNISSKPFRYRIRRVWGDCWTEIATLMPGEKRERRAMDERDIFGLTSGVQPRFVLIRYPAYGGVIQERLSSRAGTRGDVVMPFHFVVDDSNGEQITIQAEGLAQAEAAQAMLRAKKPLAPDVLQSTLAQMRMAGLLIPSSPLYYGFDGEPSTEFSIHAPVHSAPGATCFGSASGCCGACAEAAFSPCCGQ